MVIYYWRDQTKILISKTWGGLSPRAFLLIWVNSKIGTLIFAAPYTKEDFIEEIMWLPTPKKSNPTEA